MKKYIMQIFYEGLGASIYKPFRKAIDTKIDSKKIKNVLISIISVFYIIIVISVCILLFLLTCSL